MPLRAGWGLESRSSGYYGGNCLGGKPQVPDELAIFAFLVIFFLNAQQERWVNGDEDRRSIREHVRLSSHPGNRDDATEQATRRRGSERNDPCGFYDGAFMLKPPVAAFDLVGVRPLVQALLAARLVLEMLD